MNDKTGSTATSRSRLVVIAAVTLAVVAAVIVWAVLGGDDQAPAPVGEGANSGASAPADSAPPGAGSPSQPGGPSAQPTGVPLPGDPNAPAPSLPPVPLDQPVDYGDGVSAAIIDVTAFQAQGQGVGQTSGPAVRVTISITNGTAEDLSLDAVTVNLASGPELSPAAPVNDPSARPFAGIVPSGASTEGGYAFSLPEDARGSISVTVNYTVGSVTAVFVGPVP